MSRTRKTLAALVVSRGMFASGSARAVGTATGGQDPPPSPGGVTTSGGTSPTDPLVDAATLPASPLWRL